MDNLKYNIIIIYNYIPWSGWRDCYIWKFWRIFRRRSENKGKRYSARVRSIARWYFAKRWCAVRR